MDGNWKLVAILLLGLLVGVLSDQVALPVKAAPAKELPATCEEWALAGAWTIWKCTDESGYELCMHSESGFMQCRLPD